MLGLFNKKADVKKPLPPMTADEYNSLVGICALWFAKEEKKLSGIADTHDSVFRRIVTFNLYNTNKVSFSLAFTNDSFTDVIGRLLQLFLSIKIRFGEQRIQAMINDLVTELDGNAKFTTVHEDYGSFKELVNNHQFLVLIPIFNTIELNQ